MGILARIAWRNIWRNPRRSWVLISALAVGVFCFLGGIAYMDGFTLQMIDSAIEQQGGHIQITGRGFHDNPTIRTFVADATPIESYLTDAEGLRYAPQVKAPGMINSAEQASGTLIVGVDPRREPTVSNIPEQIVEGVYLPEVGAGNEVVIGAGLSERLNVLVGERVVLMANDLNNEISSGAYRVAGLYRTSSSDFDRAHVFLHSDVARSLIGYGPNQVSAFTVNLDPVRDLDETAAELHTAIGSPDLEILTWKERSPLLLLMTEMMGIGNVILVIVLFSAIGFSIANSFLMVIFERIREIGIMMADGVRPGQIRRMLYLEALFTLLIGTVAGGVMAFALITWWGNVGLDLSAYSEGLNSFGAASVLYPHMDWEHVTSGFIMIYVMVLLSVVYPAFKAGRFEIADAIQHV